MMKTTSPQARPLPQRDDARSIPRPPALAGGDPETGSAPALLPAGAVYFAPEETATRTLAETTGANPPAHPALPSLQACEVRAEHNARRAADCIALRQRHEARYHLHLALDLLCEAEIES